MNLETITAFITVVNNGNISNAAQVLYTSQSNISRRISQLENELGVPLIVRSPGQQNVELTTYGQAFLAYAKQINALALDMQSIRTLPYRTQLSIGAIEPFNLHLFVPFYKYFMKNHPEILLSIHTYHSTELYSRVSNHVFDLGFAVIERTVSDVKVSVLFQEPAVICVRKPCEGIYDGISITDLPPEKEIFLRWNETYEANHNKLLPDKLYKIRVSTESMLFDFMDEPGTWGIVPMGSAVMKSSSGDYDYYLPEEHLYTRRIYALENKYPRPSREKAIRLFMNELHDYFNKNAEFSLSRLDSLISEHDGKNQE